MKYPDSVILIFSKAPVVGEVKTRLVPYIRPEQAARLHEELTHDRLQVCTAAGLCDVQLWCSPDTQHPFFADCQHRYAIELHKQQGHDLGERMSDAIQTMLKRYKRVIIIGSDAPALGIDAIEAVVNELETNNIVLIPAEDGGYVLLGVSGFQEGLLAAVPWGSEEVLACTLRNVQRLGLEYSLLGECWDVDRPEDLER
ncbi:MAG: TIGR04282 family arsenosugar biosynthesis glycosyltransferase, partial [Thiotrichales bacterium]